MSRWIRLESNEIVVGIGISPHSTPLPPPVCPLPPRHALFPMTRYADATANHCAPDAAVLLCRCPRTVTRHTYVRAYVGAHARARGGGGCRAAEPLDPDAGSQGLGLRHGRSSAHATRCGAVATGARLCTSRDPRTTAVSPPAVCQDRRPARQSHNLSSSVFPIPTSPLEPFATRRVPPSRSPFEDLRQSLCPHRVCAGEQRERHSRTTTDRH